MNKSTKRIDWIDALKGLGMFFVIWGHAFSTNKGIIRRYIYSFHMPLFFFASGLSSLKDLELDFKTFLSKKIKTLLIPYFVVNLFAIVINYILIYFNIIEYTPLWEYLIGTIYSHDEVFLIPIGPSWFIITLFLVQVLFYLINKLSKNDYQLFNYSIICALFGYLNSISKYEIYGPWHIETVFTAVFFYFLGNIFIKNINKIEQLFINKKKAFVLGLCLFLISFFFQLDNQNVSMHVNQYGAIVSFYISSLSSIFGLYILVNLFLSKSVVFKSIGKYSLFYLLYHYFFILIYQHYFEFFLSGNLSYFFLAIIVSLVMFPFSFLINKYCSFMLGKSKKINLLVDKVFDKI